MREESSKPAELSLVSTETVCREASLLTLSLSFMLQLSRGHINYKQQLLPKEKKKNPHSILSQRNSVGWQQLLYYLIQL